MSRLGRAVLSILGVLFLTFSVAGTAFATPAWVTFRIAKLADASMVPAVFFVIPDVAQNPGFNCGGPLDFFVLDSAATYYKTQSALLMEAYLAGKRVTLALDTTQCIWTRPRITQVTIQD